MRLYVGISGRLSEPNEGGFAAGESVFAHDFPPRSDIADGRRRGPKTAERMEFEFVLVVLTAQVENMFFRRCLGSGVSHPQRKKGEYDFSELGMPGINDM
jgi:hypothetical protein